ncbi:hypothetical protein SAY87_010027 [Trapa incisa]|uniref:Uncharacterized protein n=1 Tax=Trapa incisa TaxID=236973 RepID=A0AAN7GIW9_9MYRT|nr:hypothetical protein SAY87_010027 [Trapa incisa]
MVGSMVRVAMGFRKSPENDSPARTPLASPASSRKGTSTKVPFSRYFPRSSAQVQPRPPDIAELLRLVEDLRDRESRLKTELLENKLVKETASLVPILESVISSKNAEIAASARRVDDLVAQNRRLTEELAAVRSELEEERRKSDCRVKAMEAEIAQLKETASYSDRATDKLSPSQRFQELVKSMRNKSVSARFTDSASSQESCNRLEAAESRREEVAAATTEAGKPRHSRSNSEEIIADPTLRNAVRSRTPRVPNPPPKRSASFPSSSDGRSSENCHFPEPDPAVVNDTSALSLPAPPPPPPPPPPQPSKAPPPPLPPPPPPPPRSSKAPPPPPPLPEITMIAPPPPLPMTGWPVQPKVRRVPEVVELYHSLMRRDSRRESGGGAPSDGAPCTANARDMIGEIENRSAHLHAIKTDVETQGDFIRFLIKEVEEASFVDIKDVVAFVKWLDDELSYLVNSCTWHEQAKSANHCFDSEWIHGCSCG